MTDKIRKYILPNIPYLFIGWACLKLGTALPSGGRAGASAGWAEHRPGFADLCRGSLDWLVALWGRWPFAY